MSLAFHRGYVEPVVSLGQGGHFYSVHSSHLWTHAFFSICACMIYSFFNWWFIIITIEILFLFVKFIHRQFVYQLWMGFLSWFLFPIIGSYCIAILLIFVCWFCVLHLCYTYFMIYFYEVFMIFLSIKYHVICKCWQLGFFLSSG